MEAVEVRELESLVDLRDAVVSARDQVANVAAQIERLGLLLRNVEMQMAVVSTPLQSTVYEIARGKENTTTTNAPAFTQRSPSATQRMPGSV
ncbi:Uncharacterized protein PBTT_08668 [Plasmodiophora brassicae]|uniref:Uncharacterized protein n=1 Tax=Plasmodiophora brassicae TaxID=37360 RepID=A0A0G4IKB3_PLABS|nr:hypothetical protein PBRA_004404 [Plasmodiophora brassicae]